MHGIPKKVFSDRGLQFALQFMEDLCNILEMKKKLLTAYHPQSDSQMERINQVVKAFL